MYTNLQTLRRHIFHALQHFATKLGNSTNFRMLFLTVVKDLFVLARLKVSLTCKLSINYGKF